MFLLQFLHLLLEKAALFQKNVKLWPAKFQNLQLLTIHNDQFRPFPNNVCPVPLALCPYPTGLTTLEGSGDEHKFTPSHIQPLIHTYVNIM